MANKLENFVIALGNLDVAVMLRIDRFHEARFSTVVEASQVLPDIPHDSDGYTPPDLQQEIQGLINPVAPSGSAIESTVEDLQGQTRLKVQRARQAVYTTLDLLGHDLLQGTFWIDVRRKQDARRGLGKAPTAAWTRVAQGGPAENSRERVKATQSDEVLAAAFVHSTDPELFYSGSPPPAADTPAPPPCVASDESPGLPLLKRGVSVQQ